jgi:hypothetical protein
MAAAKAQVVATETFYCYEPDDAGNYVERIVEKGERLPAAHPIVESHRELFKKTKAA